MNPLSFSVNHAITFFSILALVSAFAALTFRTLHLCIRTYAVQSFCLGITALLLGVSLRESHIILISILVMGVKGVFIPGFLERTMEKIRIKRELDPLVHYSVSALLGVGFTLLSYTVVGRIDISDSFVVKGFSLALTFILLGLWLMVCRKKAMMHVIGLLIVENGLFTAALSTSFKMPMIVELGLVFDLLVAVIILGLLIFRIQATYQSINTEYLDRLRG